jgi:mevalonate pyrophosphate decarboxylase
MYIVEFTAESLEGSDQWGAFVSISVPSDNPMHLTNVVPKRRVSADMVLLDQHAAEAEAESAAMAILDELRSPAISGGQA